MAKSSKPDVDDVRYSHQRTKVIFAAIESVANEEGVSFVEMDFDAKRSWLNDRMREVVERAIAFGGSGYENLRDFHIFVVESNGSAVLYFERV